MCDDIGIISRDGTFKEWCGDKKELSVFCPNGIWRIGNEKVDINAIVTITSGPTVGEQITEGDICLCDVDHNQTAFVNGFTYSKIDPDGEWDCLCGYYYQQPTFPLES